MEMITKEIRIGRIGRSIFNQSMLDEDYNIPDSKPDVQRIIVGQGNVHVHEIKSAENAVCVCGVVETQILYVGEGIEPCLVSAAGTIPFEERIYTEQAELGFVVRSSRVELQVSMIHSRKLRLKAMLELEIASEYETQERLPLEADTEHPLFCKTEPVELLGMFARKKDTYRVKEEITLPGTKESFGTILWCDVGNRKLDTKLLTDELQLMGELQVFCFYESPDGKIDWIEQTVPYSGRIECLGADADMFHQVQVDLEEVHLEVRMDEDGEPRALGVEGSMRAAVVIYKEEQLEILSDAYSLEKRCVLEKTEACYETLVLQNHSKCKVAERLLLPELKSDILQICHTGGSVQLDEMKPVQDGVLVEGALHVSFLYVKANDDVPFDIWQGVVPFSYLVECKEATEELRSHITSTLEQLTVGFLGGNEVEIKAVLGFQCFFRKEIQMKMITDLKLEEIDPEELENRPGVVGYVVKEGDTLWELSKRYWTTPESILAVNELSEADWKAGERILILKENMSIL